MGGYEAVQTPMSTGHGLGENGRCGGMQDAVSIPLPGTVEGPIPGRGEGALGRAQADADGVRQAPKLPEIPAEFVGDGGSQRVSKFLMKGLPIDGRRGRQVPRHQQSNLPVRQRAKELRMPVQERAKVGRHILRHHIHKRMSSSVFGYADGPRRVCAASRLANRVDWLH